MSNIEWKVGDLCKRVKAVFLSNMPVGYEGVVTEVDIDDPDQPVCVDGTYWPYVGDIVRVDA